ncbi:MAG TPA: response regulator transcription factor [Anaerolineales bacterium]
MSEPIRILVADDHPVVRDGLVAMLGTQPDFLVVGEAANGAEAVEKAGLAQPDVVLLDLEMPGMDGVEALRQLRQRFPQVRALVFTAFDTDERILGALQAGAQGYLLKGAPRHELFQAIRVVSQGGSLLQPVVASKLLRHMSSAKPGAGAGPRQGLTPRELEVLGLLGQGKTNKEIAAELVISERTAKFHISSILRKLGAGNRTEALKLAAQAGLIELKEI